MSFQVGVSICTAGMIIAVAPAIAGYAMTAYTGSLALAGEAATVISIGAGALAIGTIAIGVNEGINTLTGFNPISSIIGQEAYNVVSSIIAVGSYMYIVGGASLPYPSTGSGESKNLKEQFVMGGARNYPNNGRVIVSSLRDKRFPGLSKPLTIPMAIAANGLVTCNTTSGLM